MVPILSIIRNTSFRNLWLGQIFSQIAANILVYALIIALYERTQSNTQVSILVMTVGIPGLLLGIIAGVLVDRWSKVSVLFWCNIIRAVVCFGFIFVHENTLSLYIVSLLVSIATQFFVPAEVPVIPKIVKKNELFGANSIFTFSYYLSMAAGFIFAGPFISSFGEGTTFTIIALCFLAAAIFVKRVQVVEKKSITLPSDRDFRAIVESAKTSFKVIVSNKKVLDAVMLFTIVQSMITTLAGLAPGFADKVLGIGLTNASLVIVGPSVLGVIVSSLILANTGARWPKYKIISTGIVGSGLILALIALFIRFKHAPKLITLLEGYLPPVMSIDRLDLAVGLFFLYGVLSAAIIVPLNTIIQEEIPEEMHGRVYGFLTALGGGASIFPVLIAGKVADTFGVGRTILLLSIFIITLGVYRIVKAKYNK